MVRSALALAVVLSVASLSRAADLFTPSAYVGGNSYGTCKLVNISSASMSARIQMIGSGGGVVQDSGSFTAGPGQVWAIYDFFPFDWVYCRFVNASIHKVRGSLTVVDSASNNSDGTDTAVVAAQ
jgi:hypothetical protein